MKMSSIMRDSQVTDDWLRQVIAANPPTRQPDTTGKTPGCITTGPVRLAFCEHPIGGLLRPNAPKPDQSGKVKNPNFNTSVLFPPGLDFTPIVGLYNEALQKWWSDKYDAGTREYLGLHSPFRDQKEKAEYKGYTPGGILMQCSSQFKPTVVDSAMNPIVDETQLYAGIWAILLLNVYAYGRNPPQPKKGIGFGLQAVMKLDNDTKLGGGGAVDAKTAFGGVNVVAPTVNPASLFGAAGGAPPPPPAQQAPSPCFVCGSPMAAGAAVCGVCGSPR